MSDPTDHAPQPEQEDATERTARRGDRRMLRRRTLKFVIVFVVSVLALLSGHEYAKRTIVSDWYLLQVARSTAWLLRRVGDAASLGDPGRLLGREAMVRRQLEAWQKGTVAPPEDPPEAPPANAPGPPLTPWEAWRYKVLTERRKVVEAAEELARLEQDTSLQEPQRSQQIADARTRYLRLRTRDLGPLVTFTLKPGAAQRLAEARAELERLKADASLEAERARLEERLAELEAELKTLDKAAEHTRLAMNEKRKQVKLLKDADAGTGTVDEALAEVEQEVADLKAESLALRQRRAGKNFNFVVIPDCGAIPSMSIFVAAVLAFPALWRKRLAGILMGLPILYIVNAFRLAFLAVVGAWDNAGTVFQFSHYYLWQGIYIVFVVAVWMSWVEFLVKRRA